VLELVARLTVVPGDFVTLDHEQAKRCREALLEQEAARQQAAREYARDYNDAKYGGPG
jgi:hypothetical protein